MANTTSSSSAEAIPHQNAELKARYTMVAAKNRSEEQGFYLDDSLENYSLEPMIYNRLRELGWFRLARKPARANLNWVLEFYTNNAAGEDNVIVREDEDYETIKDYICEEGTTWNTTGRNPHSVSRPNLRPEAKLWNTFVKRTLMPTSHNQTVDRTRLMLINAIITGYCFNVGEVIAQELAAACRNEKGILAFPYIITALCRRDAVPAYPGDKHTFEKASWSRKEYMQKMDIVDATLIRIAMPTPPTSPVRSTTAAHDEVGPSTPAEAQPSPPTSPPIVPVSSHTLTRSPTTTPAAMPASREQRSYTGFTLGFGPNVTTVSTPCLV
ncbi:hypothetical protein V6N11_017416 [Hibiscus sabdariffa]|uniref:Putative plant transposon protein domain-containing protein n=1 Tax=Hibiscus sabdariffa TaxID=183260 RepID=A0ABR2TYG9_9ROSI